MANRILCPPIGWNERVEINNAIVGLRSAIERAIACLEVLEKRQAFIEDLVVEHCKKKAQDHG